MKKTCFPLCDVDYEGINPINKVAFPLVFPQTKAFSPIFAFFSAKFLLNHADVSFHKLCAVYMNILDQLVLGSFIHVTNAVRVGQNAVNHLYVHHPIPHISVEPSQPLSTTSSPPCFEFPFPRSQMEKIWTKHLHMLQFGY